MAHGRDDMPINIYTVDSLTEPELLAADQAPLQGGVLLVTLFL